MVKMNTKQNPLTNFRRLEKTLKAEPDFACRRCAGRHCISVIPKNSGAEELLSELCKDIHTGELEGLRCMLTRDWDNTTILLMQICLQDDIRLGDIQ